ncbi:Helix-turn-helix transcriptional regulator [Rhodovastum atsumiense]|uniref:Helix-turn-helix transcriptional regulator n=1 Tax=Rhodovastum atsumiense TaxID=504468 RepID=A0A5M6IU27_9PROT|nr:AraC family transcriptional regulator [Rhodovastum atsumiense]KAA5611439.1 helix-turn-helix transcriptional regulator [Rhodovastum atsumiense]CAH2601122.1 Helix-turn-helix transcriptional regulator [Rhodovastum atsumiense]
MKLWGNDDCLLARFDIAPTADVMIDRALPERIVFLSFRGCRWSSQCRGVASDEAECSVIVRNAGDIYSARLQQVAKTGGICRELHVSPGYLTMLRRQAGLGRDIDFTIMQHRRTWLGDMLFAAHGAAERGDGLAFECMLLGLVRALTLAGGDSDAPRRRSRNHQKIARTIEYMRQHYSEPISLRDLADTAGMNHFVFLRNFKQHAGVTPHEYLRSFRVNRVRDLMRVGHSSVDAALMSGFADQSHMIRSFKRKTGLTPGAIAFGHGPGG